MKTRSVDGFPNQSYSRSGCDLSLPEWRKVLVHNQKRPHPAGDVCCRWVPLRRSQHPATHLAQLHSRRGAKNDAPKGPLQPSGLCAGLPVHLHAETTRTSIASIQAVALTAVLNLAKCL